MVIRWKLGGFWNLLFEAQFVCIQMISTVEESEGLTKSQCMFIYISKCPINLLTAPQCLSAFINYSKTKYSNE